MSTMSSETRRYGLEIALITKSAIIQGAMIRKMAGSLPKIRIVGSKWSRRLGTYMLTVRTIQRIMLILADINISIR